MIGLLFELLQQVKYEGVDVLEDVICIAVNKKDVKYHYFWSRHR